ncbi:MAG: hypothetical protein L3K26_00375 [Candidatus Hydrogenedentes bacterium]|nr:hypothetical protein [Candidatus Hydrogenedentota bacterium]
MLTRPIGRVVLGMGVALLSAAGAFAHEGHTHDSKADSSAPERIVIAAAAGGSAAPATKGVTGQGNLKFKVLHTSKALPAAAMKGLNAAHGGFAVDRREGKGEIYFALPKVGIIRISADMNKIEVLPTDETMAATNMHNTTVWYGKESAAYLTFPGNQSNKVYTTTIEGGLLNTLDAPTSETPFDEATVSKYFADGGKFVPTDVEVLDKRFYVTTGYSPLDWVLTADVGTEGGISAAWTPFAFGGKGNGPGQFGTGHGITIAPDGKTITVADRANAEIESFDTTGKHLGKLDMPKGSLPCDIDYQSGYMIVGCLKGPNPDLGAPIYLVDDAGEIKSTIMIKEDLGLEKFIHIHNAVMVERDGKFYIIAQAWNPGDFAILEQVK